MSGTLPSTHNGEHRLIGDDPFTRANGYNKPTRRLVDGPDNLEQADRFNNSDH